MIPLGIYMDKKGMGAYANGTKIHYVSTRFYNWYGIQILTHEIAHNLDNYYIGGKGRRDTFHAEYFARSLFETIQNIETDENFGLNYNKDFSKIEGGKFLKTRQANKTPERFQKQSDLKEYFGRMFDLLHTMSIAEVEILMDMPKYDIRKVVVKVEKDPNATLATVTEKNDVYRPLTNAELNAISFKSINDFIENNIVITRLLDKNQRFEAQKKHQAFAKLYDSFYGSYTSDSIYAGDMLGKRNAYFLLGNYGYEAFSNYMSNKFKADAKAEGAIYNEHYILSKTFGKPTTFTDLYKESYQKRILKKDNLKPFTYKGVTYSNDVYANMKNLLKVALEKDLVKIKSDKNYEFKELRYVKNEIFKYYLHSTDDFKSSIYK